MNRTDAPAKQPKPFGVNGQREDILPTTPVGDNTASYESGFPPITMIMKSSGGLPPKGQDMNQILYELSSLCRWFSTGAINSFDSAFATQIGGYPKGSLVLGDDGSTLFLSSIDANTNNPNSVVTGWINFTKLISIASLAGGENKLPYFTGTNTAAQTDLTAFARTVLAQTDGAGVRNTIGVYDASTSQKGLVRLNSGVSDADDTLAATSGAVKIAYDAAISAANIAKTKWSAVDATTSRKGIVMLSDDTGVPDSTTAATTTAVNYVLNQATSAYSLAESKYTAGGATTAKAGLVQLVNSMGGSGSLVMPQAAVTTAIQSYPSLGKGQILQDLKSSRGTGVTYTNSTGFPIAVYVRITGGNSANLYAYVNGTEFGGGGATASQTSIATAFFIVPNGATYRVEAVGASPALQSWTELR
ncbi:TPA: tail fiber protein [Salmonella enterica]|nr:tail fiber protein [Salmonella enterica]